MVSNNGTTLCFGFSFGLRPDGAPGKCNDLLAKHIGEFEKSLPEKMQRIAGVQWEIADARVIGSYSRPKAYYVCEPPLVKTKDIIRPGLIGCLIELQEFEAIKCLKNKLTGEKLNKRTNMSEAFNALLNDKLLFREFRALVDLHDLVREDKGILGIEKRCVPQKDDPLQEYQAKRVNRLILESIFDESIFKRGVYLNTSGVAETILKKIEVDNLQSTIDCILIFCHPSHLFWCSYNSARQVLAFQDRISFGKKLKEKYKEIVERFEEINEYPPDSRSQEIGLLTTESPIRWGELELGIQYDTNDKEWWDSESAQVWTRSKDNCDTYNSMP